MLTLIFNSKLPQHTLRESEAGFSLIELVVAMGLFFILVSGVMFVITNSYSNFFGNGDKQTVANFAKEGLEAVQSIAANDWKDIENGSDADHGIILNSTTQKWEFSGTSNVVGGLTRVINIASLDRKDGGDITDAGAGVANDPLTKLVTVTVSGSGIANYELKSIITNWGVSTWEQTDWRLGGGYNFWGPSAGFSSEHTMEFAAVTGELKIISDKGIYQPTASLISSAFSLIATDKKLYRFAIHQDVPTDCDNQIIVTVDNVSDFSSAPVQQIFHDTPSFYTVAADSSLNGYNWMMYQINMTDCDKDTQSPTLYSFKAYYR